MLQGIGVVAVAVVAALGLTLGLGLTATPAAAVDNGIRFTHRSLPTSESQGRATIEVRRAPTAALEVSAVDYRTEDLDATVTDDYESVRGRVTMGVGQASATISVYVFDDFETEGEERFALVLADTEDPDRVLDRLIVSVSDNDGVRAMWGDDDADLGADAASTAQRAAAKDAAAAAAAEAAKRRSAASVPARSTSTKSNASRNGGMGASTRGVRVTPFQLQSPAEGTGSDRDPGPSGVLAVVAGGAIALVLARVWFRWRLALDADVAPR